MTKQSLEELAARVEAATGPDRELDLDCWWWGKASGGSSKQPMPDDYRRSNLRMNDAPRYTASLDAAMTLVPEGWAVSLSTPGLFHGTPQARLKHPERNPFGEGEAMRGSAATPALALTAAALRAQLAAQEGE